MYNNILVEQKTVVVHLTRYNRTCYSKPGTTELVVPGPTELLVPDPAGLLVPGPTGLVVPGPRGLA